MRTKRLSRPPILNGSAAASAFTAAAFAAGLRHFRPASLACISVPTVRSTTVALVVPAFAAPCLGPDGSDA